MPTEADELIEIRQKLESMEKLIAFAQQLARIVESMESAQHMTRPSQMPKKRRFALLHQLVEKLKTVETDELLVRLKKLDKEVQKEIRKILVLARLKVDDVHKRFTAELKEEVAKTHETMRNELKDFSRKAQTNVAIRFTLHERGYPVESAKLPISQEQLGNQVETLKAEENNCKHKLIDHMESLIEDTDFILQNSKFPEDIKQQVKIVKTNLQNNLAHIKDGGNIDDIPVFIESLEIKLTGSVDSTPAEIDSILEEESRTTEPPEHDEPKLEDDPSLEITTEESPSSTLKELQNQYRQKGFFGRLWMWLNTPVGVTWADIKNQPKSN